VIGALPDDLELTDGVVTLRRWHDGDAVPLAVIWQDPELQRRFGVETPVTRDATAAYVRGVSERWRDGLQVSLAITADDALVGGCDLDHLTTRPDLGYWLAQSARGNGYATRAATLLLAWAAVELDVLEVVLEVEPDNAASIAVARRLGFSVLTDNERVDGARRLAVYGRALP